VQLNPADAADGVELVSFDRLLSEADLVTMHPRVTEETTGMMNAKSFAKMKPGATFVNTARGPLCDYDALTEALLSGHIGGAMLETFGVEPVPADWPLLKLDNVTLTPHIAGASVRTVTFAAEQAAEEVRRYIAGEPAWHLC
jgi:D-3-phosphoglycerate dehydrogenase